MSIDKQKKLNLGDIFPANDWTAQEHLLLTGEPIEITRAKKLGLAILETMTGPFIAAPVAFITASLLGLFNHSDAQAMGINHLPDQYSPRFENLDDLTHHLQMSEAQQAEVESCPLNIFWIQGASPPTEPPVYYPASVPCTIKYNEKGPPTLTFEDLDFSKYDVGQDQNAVLITPIAALTADGKIPFLVNTHIGEDQTDGASILCPSDFLSNALLGNPTQGSQFTNSPDSTRVCYEASEAFVPAVAFDSLGQAHPLNLSVTGDGNMFIFTDTLWSESDILKIKVGNDIHWPTAIQTSLMQGLRERFGDNAVILFAPNGVDPVAERFPVKVEVAPPEKETIIDKTQITPASPALQEEVEEKPVVKEIPTRTFYGQKLSAKLICTSNDCPEIYAIIDEKLPEFQHLMQLYTSGDIIDDQKTGDVVKEIISKSNEKKFVNLLRNIFGKEPLTTPVKKFNTNAVSLDIDEIIYISEDVDDAFMIVRRDFDDKTSLYFLIKAESNLLEKFSFSLADNSNNLDIQGSQVISNIQADVNKADPPPYVRDWKQDLFLTRPESVTGIKPGKEILHIAKEFEKEVVSGYQITSEGLSPTMIHLSSVGKYEGHLYKNPTNNELYISIETVNEAGLQTGTFLVPIKYVDTSN